MPREVVEDGGLDRGCRGPQVVPVPRARQAREDGNLDDDADRADGVECGPAAGERARDWQAQCVATQAPLLHPVRREREPERLTPLEVAIGNIIRANARQNGRTARSRRIGAAVVRGLCHRHRRLIRPARCDPGATPGPGARRRHAPSQRVAHRSGRTPSAGRRPAAQHGHRPRTAATSSSPTTAGRSQR